MQITLDKRNVDGVVELCAATIASKFLTAHPVEVLVALAQLSGRIISAQEGSKTLTDDMVKLANQQMRATVRAIHESKNNTKKEVASWH